MSNIHADFSQVHRLAADLAAAGPKVKVATAAKLSKVAIETQVAAKAAVPVDTGALRDSITVRSEGDERVVEADTSYAAFVEFGTSRMGPQPYMWPAANTAEKSLTVELEKLGDPFT